MATSDPEQCTQPNAFGAAAVPGRPPQLHWTAMLCVTFCAFLGVTLAMLMWRGLRGRRPPPKRLSQRGSARSADSTSVTACPPAPEATASNKAGDETGTAAEAGAAADSWPETPATLALAQRVKALGLHLGEVCVSGIAIGLPNGGTPSGRRVFDDAGLDELFSGVNMIHGLPPHLLQAQLERNVVQISKGPTGERLRKPISALHEVVQLASRIGEFDLVRTFP